eukprot:gb/GEZN01010373.1/.p1 GENE.gb/GEZN01010373.1/~~gb/GEZN01010373.1/.p1  ORF type:complete len:360 (+),score=42.98 gb/GEZN01010373.1/:121-1200(+)
MATTVTRTATSVVTSVPRLVGLLVGPGCDPYCVCILSDILHQAGFIIQTFDVRKLADPSRDPSPYGLEKCEVFVLPGGDDCILLEQPGFAQGGLARLWHFHTVLCRGLVAFCAGVFLYLNSLRPKAAFSIFREDLFGCMPGHLKGSVQLVKQEPCKQLKPSEFKRVVAGRETPPEQQTCDDFSWERQKKVGPRRWNRLNKNAEAKNMEVVCSPQAILKDARLDWVRYDDSAVIEQVCSCTRACAHCVGWLPLARYSSAVELQYEATLSFPPDLIVGKIAMLAWDGATVDEAFDRDGRKAPGGRAFLTGCHPELADLIMSKYCPEAHQQKQLVVRAVIWAAGGLLRSSEDLIGSPKSEGI